MGWRKRECEHCVRWLCAMAMRCAERSGKCTMLWQHEFYMVYEPRHGAYLATLRRYCVHSTLVPVVVPIFFFPHDWEIYMKELLLSNGRVLDGKRGKRGTRLAKFPIQRCVRFFFSNLLHQPLSKSLFCPLCVCLSFFGLSIF